MGGNRIKSKIPDIIKTSMARKFEAISYRISKELKYIKKFEFFAYLVEITQKIYYYIKKEA